MPYLDTESIRDASGTAESIKEDNRIAYLDVLKTLAIIGVIAIHISAGLLSYIEIGSNNWYFYVFWASVVRWSVPVFFMCSGVVFLDPGKNIPVRRIFTKYLFRIVIALIFWACMYELFDVLRDFYSTGAIDTVMVKNSVKNILTFNTHFHLYYLYIIILIYIFVPVIKAFTGAAGKRLLEYALIVWIAFGVIFPFALAFYPFNLLRGMVLQYGLKMAYSSMGFFIMGHYLHRYPLSKRVTYAVYLAGIAGFFTTAFGTIALSSQDINTVFLEGMTPNVAAMAIALFLFAKNLISKYYNEKSGSVVKAVTYISKASFCVYLVHDFFNIIFRAFNLDRAIWNVFVSVPLLTLLNLLLSICVYFILSKTPYVKKYLI